MAELCNALRPNLVYVAWFQAAVATFGSLFFSEIMKLPPCVLCWYQRIAMYPLVLILATSILRKDGLARVYGLPLALIGLVIAVYHNLLYYKVIPDSIKPCTSGISCTAKQIEWLGFITIPFLSLLAFSVVTICLVFGKANKTSLGEVE
jgi:disulfide bond formation protein DsbB